MIYDFPNKFSKTGGFIIDKYDLDSKPIKEARLYGFAWLNKEGGYSVWNSPNCDLCVLPMWWWLKHQQENPDKTLKEILDLEEKSQSIKGK